LGGQIAGEHLIAKGVERKSPLFPEKLKYRVVTMRNKGSKDFNKHSALENSLYCQST